MRVCTARDVHAGGQQYFAFEVDVAEMAAWSDVNFFVDLRADLRKQRPEFDARRRCTATAQHTREKSAPQVLPADPGNQRQSL